MNGMRLRPGGLSGHLALGLVSALVLLAFACFPLLAQADSSEVQYSNPVPTATGTPPPAHHEPVAKKSDTGGTTTSPAGSGSDSNRREVGSHKGSSPGNGGSPEGKAPKSGTGQGSPGHGSSGKTAAESQQDTQTGKPASKSDGGSSPAAAILIGILVLAGISLGIVMVRQRRRRQAGGPSVSPKAS